MAECNGGYATGIGYTWLPPKFLYYPLLFGTFYDDHNRDDSSCHRTFPTLTTTTLFPQR